MAWQAVAKLSLLRKSRNCVGLRGDWQLVTLTRLLLLSKKKKKKNVNEPLQTFMDKDPRAGLPTVQPPPSYPSKKS